MTIETTFVTRLLSQAGLTALIGDRLYPSIVPEGKEVLGPCLVYELITNPEQEHCMVGDVGITNPRIQYTAWADTKSEAVAVIAQVKAALQRYSTTGIQDTFLATEPYDVGYDNEAKKHGRAIDVRPFVEE